MTATPTVTQDYLAIVDDLRRECALPKVKQVWLPPVRDTPEKSAEFGAVILADDSVGLMYMLLRDTLPEIRRRFSPDIWEGMNPVELAQGFGEPDPVHRVLGLGAINAIGQHVMRRCNVALDTQTNSIASFDPQPEDRMGMVGFFPPLVERLRNQNIDLTVIELKAELVQQAPRFRVTLDPGALVGCNKILCTSTLLLNDSIEPILKSCAHADQVAIIGPGAGFLPDPLFARGIHTVGGNQVLDVEGFIARCEAEEKWGPSTQKYCLHRHTYPGYRALLERLR